MNAPALAAASKRFDWTKKQTDELRHLFVDKGMSAGQIAIHFDCGLSRNAIIGKIHRLGITHKQKPVACAKPKPAPPRATKPAPPRATKPKTPARADEPAKAPGATSDPPAASPASTALPHRAVDDPSAAGVPFLELKPRGCRYPVADVPERLFCGVVRSEGAVAYCERHAAIGALRDDPQALGPRPLAERLGAPSRRARLPRAGRRADRDHGHCRSMTAAGRHKTVRPFVVEHRRLPPRHPARFSAPPDDIAELRQIAATVRNLPRDWIESWPDLFNAMRRVGGKILNIADRLEPIQPKASCPIVISPSVSRRCRARAAAARQLEMML